MTSLINIAELATKRHKYAAVYVYPHHVVGVITSIAPLREREFHAGQVLSFKVLDSKGDSCGVYFYDAWARAMAFADVGDEIRLNSFRVLPIPVDVLVTSSSTPVGSTPAAETPDRFRQTKPSDATSGSPVPETRRPVPQPEAVAPASASPTKASGATAKDYGPLFFLTPAPAQESTAVIAQPAEQNDVIEFQISPLDFDNPTAKVRKNIIGQPSTQIRMLVNDIPGGKTVC
jgi:hypothetical protein